MSEKQVKIIKTSGIVLGIVIIISIIIGLISIYGNKKDSKQIEFLKDYKVNEYIPTYISEEQMARIYLNDFVNLMFRDTEEAYNLLDQEYREKKFGTLDNFVNYVNNLPANAYTLKKYRISDTGLYQYFYIYDNNDNYYIFKTEGVLQYKVYLDEDTVEIK